MARPGSGGHDALHRHDAWHRDVERFGARSARYERSPLQRLLADPVHRAVVRLAAAATPSPGHVVDLGCGTGRLLRRLADRFPRARTTGIDPAAGMLATARAAWPDRSPAPGLLRAVAEALPLRTGSADLAVSTLSAHHWAEPAAGLTEIGRVLEPGGVLVLVDLFPTGWRRRVASAIRPRHLTLLAPDDLERLLAAAGFERVDWYPLPRRLHLVDAVVARRSARAGAVRAVA